MDYLDSTPSAIVANAEGHHVAELDGIRGMAIILTLLVHLGMVMGQVHPLDALIHRISEYGIYGVELFFVLSGFLITGILLRARERASGLGSYLGRFMWRRALRIFPLYYAALATLFLVVPRLITFNDPAIVTLRANQAWYWTYTVNWLYALRGGAQVPFQTSHFWTLAVEEQFYLVWPLLVWLAGARRLPMVAGGLWAASIVLRAMLMLTPGPQTLVSAFDPRGIMTPLHLDALMAGSLIAWLSTITQWDQITPWLRRALPISVLALLLARGPVFPPTAAAVVAATLLVAALTLPETHWLRVGFRGRTLHVFGKYSYCLYVVHYPLMNVLDRVVPKLRIPAPGGSTALYGLIYGAILVSTSMLISVISWRVFEQPILRLKDRGSGFLLSPQ